MVMAMQHNEGKDELKCLKTMELRGILSLGFQIVWPYSYNFKIYSRGHAGTKTIGWFTFWASTVLKYDMLSEYLTSFSFSLLLNEYKPKFAFRKIRDIQN